MRELVNITERKVFRDEAEIELAIQVSKGNLVSNNQINEADAQNMVEGETRIDSVNNRSVHKVNGRLYKQVVVNSEVVFEEMQ